MTRQLTPRGEERREQLLDTAARLFAGAGYHRTSVSDIVNACAVGKGVFYWYFDSKEMLFTTLLDEGLNSLRKAQKRRIDLVDDPVDKITEGIRASLDFFVENPNLFRLLELASSDSEFHERYTATIDTAVADTNQHVKDAMRLGSIPQGDPYFIGHGITTITMTFIRRFLLGDEPRADQEAVVHGAVDFCLHGMGLAREP